MNRLLWIDATGGLSVGVGVLLLSGWLSGVFGLSRPLLLGMGAANLAYGCFSFALARRRRRPRALLTVLIAANAAWSLFCAVTAVVTAPAATWLGTGHLLLESLFVGGLAWLEWRAREILLTA